MSVGTDDANGIGAVLPSTITSLSLRTGHTPVLTGPGYSPGYIAPRVPGGPQATSFHCCHACSLGRRDSAMGEDRRRSVGGPQVVAGFGPTGYSLHVPAYGLLACVYMVGTIRPSPPGISGGLGALFFGASRLMALDIQSIPLASRSLTRPFPTRSGGGENGVPCNRLIGGVVN